MHVSSILLISRYTVELILLLAMDHKLCLRQYFEILKPNFVRFLLETKKSSWEKANTADLHLPDYCFLAFHLLQ